MKRVKQKIGRRFRGLRRSLSVVEHATSSAPALTAPEVRDSDRAFRPASAGGYAVSLTGSRICQPQAPAQSPSPENSAERPRQDTAVLAYSEPLSATPIPRLVVENVSSDEIISQSQASSTSSLATELSLWARAFNKLSESDKKVFPFTGIDKNCPEGLLGEIKNHRDICQQNRWKFTFRKKDIIVRDVVDKLLSWVEKFRDIGDIVVQYDPAHAALPWAGVRFLLQLSLSDKEAMGVVIIGVERIARLLVRGAVHEELYLRSVPTISVRLAVEEILVELYSAVLEFLACAMRYLTEITTARILRTLLDLEGAKSLYDTIEERELLLEKELTVAERELQEHRQRTLEGGTEKLKALLEEIEKPIMRLDSNVALMYDEFQGHLQEEKRKKILEWLSKVEYIKHHQKAKEDILEDTGQWLLNKREFRQWRSSSSSGILWLHGIPGAGKTKLTCMVIDVLSQGQEPVVYFYFNRNESQRQDPEVLMQVIVKQLSVVLPGLPKPVVGKYDEREMQGLAAGSLGFQESQDLIVALLDIYPQTTIVIDALDESDLSKRWLLLKALNNVICSSASLVKIFISSRDDIDIKLKLEQVPNLYIDAQDNSGDIERFVIREVTNSIIDQRLLHGNVTDELKTQIISTIVEKAKGMFQWANLQIKHLYKLRFEEEIKESLGRLPETLEETYSKIWNEIHSGTPQEQEVTRKALMWIMCSKVPLNKEIWAEGSYWPKCVPRGGIDVLFDLCRNLVTWDKQLSRVIFVHLSVHEYLESRCFNSMDANSMAAESCLLLFDNPPQCLEVKEPINSLQNMTFSCYSTVYWMDHVENSYNCEQYISRRMLGLLQLFLGACIEPGQSYCRWLKAAGVLIRRLRGFRPDWHRKLRKILHSLDLIQPNPLFALSYFRFGQELKEQWECDSLDINSKNSRGETLLFVASKRGNEGVIDLLLRKGADVNVGDGEGRSPLVAAIESLQEGAVVKLLDKGADFSVGVHQKRNVLEVAAMEGNGATMKMLLAKDGNMKVTEAVLTAAAANRFRGKEIMEALLARDGNTKITEAVLTAAAANLSRGKEIMEVLLARDGNTKITEAVLTAVAANPFRGKEIMEVLLARDGNIKITEAVLVAAAANPNSSQPVTEVLRARSANINAHLLASKPIPLTELGGKRAPILQPSYSVHQNHYSPAPLNPPTPLAADFLPASPVTLTHEG